MPPAAGPRLPDHLLVDLRRRYEEPHRHYHTLAHVEALLAWLAEFRSLAREPDTIAAAIWFHDAIYAPTGTDNEQRSAALARAALTAARWPAASVDRVVDLVLATQHHRAPPEDADAWFFLDLDLGVLGQDWPTYDRYRHAVRSEFAHVPEAAFQAGRAAVLQAFLRREAIYVTPTLRERWEAQARANLRRELATATAD